MNQNEPTDLKGAVLSKIKTHEVRMRPRLYFILRAVAVIALAFFILAVTIAIVNVIFFTLRVNGHESLLHFGWRGVWVFFELFPWPLVALDLVLVALLEWLLHRFRFAYRAPALYVLIMLIAVGGTLGLAVDRGTPLNDDLLRGADHDQVPAPLGAFYEGLRQPPPADKGVYRGVITNVSGDQATIVHEDFDKDSDDGTRTIQFPSNFGTTSLQVGDHLYCAGDNEEGTIHAYGCTVLSPEPESD